MAKSPRQLNAKKRKMIDHFMKGKSRKDAALEAGYSRSTAVTGVAALFSDPLVQAEIERRQRLAAMRSDVDLDWVIQRLKMIAEADVGEALDIYSDGSAKLNLNKFTPQLKYALSKFSSKEFQVGRGSNAQKAVENTVAISDKLRALELIVRHLGLSKEKQVVEHTGEVGVVERLQRARSRAGIGGGSDIKDNEDE